MHCGVHAPTLPSRSLHAALSPLHTQQATESRAGHFLSRAVIDSAARKAKRSKGAAADGAAAAAGAEKEALLAAFCDKVGPMGVYGLGVDG